MIEYTATTDDENEEPLTLKELLDLVSDLPPIEPPQPIFLSAEEQKALCEKYCVKDAEENLPNSLMGHPIYRRPPVMGNRITFPPEVLQTQDPRHRFQTKFRWLKRRSGT